MIRAVLSIAFIVSTGSPLCAQTHKAGDTEIESRSASTPDGKTIRYELGTVYVPENRSNPSSRLIGVGFARFMAEQPTAAPPIFLLPGGPGGSYLTRLDSTNEERRGRFLTGLRRYLRVADVVLVDQRGFSQRGDRLTFKYRWPETRPDQLSSLDQRVEQFRAFAESAVGKYTDTSVDLAGYSVKECAHDVNDLRAALGYEQITLNGTSFGSQWSFAIMRLHPEIVARALLSGVEPLDHGYDMPSHVFAALLRMWQPLEQDPRFKPHLPPGGIAEAARVVIERLEREPLRINAQNSDGDDIEILLGPEDLSVWDPASILELYHERYERWQDEAKQNDDRREIDSPLIGPLIDSSLGVTPQRRYRLWNDPATRFLGRDNFALYLATADIWPSPDVGDAFRTPVVSQIPVVFAQGDWDTSTPIENAYEIAPFFPNSRMLVAERGGHGVLNPIARELPEVWATLENFLRTGEMSGIPGRVRLKPSRNFQPPRFAKSGRSP